MTGKIAKGIFDNLTCPDKKARACATFDQFFH